MHRVSRRAIERTSPRFRRPVALLVRTGDASMEDRLPGLAAEIAFWVLLSLPALVLTALSAASVFLDVEGQDLHTQIVTRIAEVARVALTENTVQEYLIPVLQGLLEEGGFGLVSTAAIATVWTASRAVRVVLTTLTIVSNNEGRRAGWHDRLLGFGITLGALLFGIVLAPLLLAGPAFGETLQGWVDFDLGPVPEIWRRLYWPTTVLAAMLTISLLYYLGVPGRTRWSRALPGAVVATLVWLAGSAGLRLYGMWIAAGESVYGPLAGPVVALLWLWLTGFAVLLGAELNAQVDQVWPVGDHESDLDALLGEHHRQPGLAHPPSDGPEEPRRRDPAAERTRPLVGPPDGTEAPRPVGDRPGDDADTTRPIDPPVNRRQGPRS